MRTLRTLNKRNYTAKIVTIFVLTVLVLWSICSIRANASEKADNDQTEYQLQEAQLKRDIRAGLNEMGYHNAGITMTKVMDADGSRTYTVLVHHQYLDANNLEKTNAVYEVLGTLDVGDDDITVNYTIF